MLALLPTQRDDDRVAIGEAPDPEPAVDQALVRIEAFSLNRTDFLYLVTPGMDGWRVGIDGAGVVERAAADGSGPPAGSRVVVHVPAGGVGAQLAAVPTSQLTALPDNVSTHAAAALPLAGLVALRMLRDAAPLEGRRVLITGATGGVGQFVVQLALAGGAQVTAVARERDPYAHLTRLGATVVHAVADAEGAFDVLLESVGGAVGSDAFGKLAPRALVQWFGGASGEPLSLDFFSFFGGHESFTLRHFVYFDTSGTGDAADLAELVALVAEAKLTPQIGFEGDWSHAAETLNAIAAGTQLGKAVLHVGS